jgi:FkbM family methyltransferase
VFETDELLGKIGRLPFKLVPPSARMPVFSGPNRGLRWIAGAGIHRCWIGTYEPGMTRLLAAQASKGMTVFDVGAHAGYYTLMLSRLVGDTGRVFAFEANSRNAANLREHIRINRINNVEITEAAVAEKKGETRFSGDGYTGKISESGLVVPTVRLDDYPTPGLIKMDIEGAETLALQGATRILSEQRTKLFVAVHQGTPYVETPALLTSHGYSVDWINERELWALPPIKSQTTNRP